MKFLLMRWIGLVSALVGMYGLTVKLHLSWEEAVFFYLLTFGIGVWAIGSARTLK